MAGYGGRNISVEIETTYEYAGSQFYDPYEFYDYLSYNLNMAQHIDNYKTDVEAIADEAVNLAREFVVSNGTYKTGALYDSIDWSPTASGIRLYASVPYSGHIEYGFVGRDGMPHGPWPFLRPAMRIAAEASTGKIADHAASDILWGVGNNNILSFGRANIDQVMRNAGGRGFVMNQVHHSYGSKNRAGINGKDRNPIGNQRRWTRASHGIDYMGRLKNDDTDEGRALYESFTSKFGEHMSSSEFRWGDFDSR